MKKNSVSKTLVAVVLVSHFGFSAEGEQNNNNTTKIPTPAPSQSMNNSAGEGKASQYLGAGMNAASGAMFFSMCSPTSAWFCAMGAISFIQAAMTLQSGNKSANVQALTSGVPDVYDPSNIDPSALDPSQLDALAPGAGAAFNDLKKKGFIDPAGNVKFNGKTVTGKDFASADAMAAAGVPAGSIGDALGGIASVSAEAMKKAEGMGNEANVVSMGVDGSGGGGGGGGRGPASDDSDSNLDDYMNKLRNPFGMDANKKAQMVAGKTVTHGDDQIGVKVDDIFRMVHLRYQSKRKSDEFIEAAVPAAVTPGAAAGAGKSSLVTPKRSR